MRMLHYSDLREVMSAKLRMLWLGWAKIRPKVTKYLEEKHSCCGWYNVFDYCTNRHMSEIMYSTLIGNSLADYAKE